MLSQCFKQSHDQTANGMASMHCDLWASRLHLLIGMYAVQNALAGTKWTAKELRCRRTRFFRPGAKVSRRAFFPSRDQGTIRSCDARPASRLPEATLSSAVTERSASTSVLYAARRRRAGCHVVKARWAMVLYVVRDVRNEEMRRR